tara:strand:+ start:2350 stop:3255 length:906 start_codon:yes stop_codon:yes gene_type:complete
MAEPMQVEDEEIEIELEETTEEGENSPQIVANEVQESKEPESSEEEIANYSESVKKRINKLTYKVREAERREVAALEYAKGVQEKLNTTQATLSQKDKNLYDEYSARVESQLSSAENRYKKAHDIGDTDEILAAQKDVAKLAVELESLNRVRPSKKEEPVTEQQPVAQQPPQQQYATSVPPQPDVKAQEWAAKNEWFGNDLAMTTSAFAFHRQLVEQEGFDPTTDEYYQHLNLRMSESFPHKLGDEVTGSQVNIVQENVANSSRGARGRTGKGRTVKLSQSQVAIAKRLGVPLEEYAKHVK